MKPISNPSNFIFIRYDHNLPLTADGTENKTKQAIKEKTCFLTLFIDGKEKMGRMSLLTSSHPTLHSHYQLTLP